MLSAVPKVSLKGIHNTTQGALGTPSAPWVEVPCVANPVWVAPSVLRVEPIQGSDRFG
jgi:hypothetical protein